MLRFTYLVAAMLLLGNCLLQTLRAAAPVPELESAPPPAQAAPAAPGVFEMPRIEAKHRHVYKTMLDLAMQRRLEEVEALLLRALLDPDTQTAVMHYHLASVRAVLGKTEAALESLSRAVDSGFVDETQMRGNPDFASLRDRPRFEELVALAASRAEPQKPSTEPVPHPIRNGIAEVAAANTVLVSQHQRFLVFHTQPAEAEASVILLYDNRDRNHSRMNLDAFPQIARLVYSEAARKVGLDREAQISFLHNMPTLGNASLAIRESDGFKTPYWRSLSRQIYQNGHAVQILADQYVNNHLYVYPEHNDHDPDYGDVFHANTPYLLTSQGSSGSDQAFLQAIARTLTALPTETYGFLAANNLLMPTAQMILRANRNPVQTLDDYLSPQAHPVVFDGGSLDVNRMVNMARALEPGQVPPMVRLRVEEEDDDTQPGVDYFEAAPSEKLFDTVSAIARVARATRRERRMVVSLDQTRDPNGRPLTFHWRVLAGDPAHVRIKLLDEAGTRAELRVAWHERGLREGGTLPNSRVDVGVFAANGIHTSAPAFVSWYFPANEKRTYCDDGRILSIEYLPPSIPESYVDPAIVTPADWHDVYRYTPDGRLLGWERMRGERVEAFTHDGALIVERDEQGRPILAQAVDYRRVQASQDQWPSLLQFAQPHLYRYVYESDEDRIGVRHDHPDANGATAD